MELVQTANAIKGIQPVLFQIGALEISAYTIFILLGLLAGILVYYFEAKKVRQTNEYTFLIAIGAFVGSTFGAKLLEMLINADRINSSNDLLVFVVSGRTIVGGLIGGTLGVWLTKRITGIKAKRGNLFAPAIALGVAIGRLGCFFNGCCYGKPSNLPWSVDFGDGVYRHPTQIYESLFMLFMFVVIKYWFKGKIVAPGYLFKFLMIAYFGYRFLVEFIRVERIAFWGITYFQVISIFVLIYLITSDKRLILYKIIGYGKSIARITNQRPG